MDLEGTACGRRLRELWAGHAGPWPSDVDYWYGDLDLAYIDSTIAGVVQSVLGSRRPPDGGEQVILRSCLGDLRAGIAQLPAAADRYAADLIEIVEVTLALTAEQRRGKPPLS